MFDSILSNTSGLDLWNVVICILVALVLGLVVALVYMKTEEQYSKNFVISLILLPAAVSAVIATVNGNLGTGIAIMGAFGLVRFRSQPGSAKEMAVVFFDMAIGLASATGYIFFTAIFALIMCLALVVLAKCNFGGKADLEKNLKITIPEDLDYDSVFEDILKKYTQSYRLESTKTTNLGSMFELRYAVVLKPNIQEQKFINELRVRNANLPIVLNVKKSDKVEL